MTVATAVAAGIAVDRWVGEPPVAVHPVAWFGRAMGRVEAILWRDSQLAGAAHVAIGAGGAWIAGRVLERMVGRPAATVVATAVCVAGRMLDAEALAVGQLLRDGDLAAARARLRSLVGRDPSGLDESGVARAVVESVAENTTDAVVAPAVWAVVGGAPAVLAHRAINTLDAMVGHRDDRYRRFGWASARLDDVVNGVPAAVAVGVVAVRRPGRWREVGRAVLVDAAHHPSPNAGLVEGAFAGVLGVGLGGVNRYGETVEDRGRLGDGADPTSADVVRAVRLRRFVGVALMAALVALDAQRVLRNRPRRRSQLRPVSSSQLTASARRSVVAT